MKRVCLISVLVGLMSWLGCGGDDGPTEPTGPTITTVTAATAAVAPDSVSVDDSIWTRITPTNVTMAVDRFASASKRRPKIAMAVASTVAVQAVVAVDSLFLRLVWDDATWDRWPGRFRVTSFDFGTLAHFTRDDLSFNEDQLMVLFDKGGSAGWDIWWWKMTTTGGGYLAQGANLTSGDPVVQTGDEIASRNEDQLSGQPEFMHPEGPNNQSYRLLTEDRVVWNVNLAWVLGDLIPGYTIDGQKYTENSAARGNRWDISARSRHSSGEYVLILRRALDTEKSTDLDLSAQSTINVRLGVTNNADFRFSAGSSKQGFSNTFKLNLP